MPIQICRSDLGGEDEENETEMTSAIVLSCIMFDPRLPITTKKLPGGYRLQCADGKSSLIIYGTDGAIALAGGSLSTEEAKALAEEIAGILTEAWG